MRLKTKEGKDLYTLQCHSAGYVGDPDFEYSGDFECRLSLSNQPNTYSTLLTEDINQSRDWESRGRFFSADLRGACAQIPEFGAVRNFRLRGMRLTLKIDPMFLGDKLTSLKLTVTVASDPDAHRAIADIVTLPLTSPASCKIPEYFVDSLKMTKDH